MESKGIFWQLKDKRIKYEKPQKGGGITRRHIKLACMYIYGLYGLYGTEDNANSHEEEELDIALRHWTFLYRYNLVVNLNKIKL